MFFFFYLARHMKFENRNSYLPLRAREEIISTGNKGSVYLSVILILTTRGWFFYLFVLLRWRLENMCQRRIYLFTAIGLTASHAQIMHDNQWYPSTWDIIWKWKSEWCIMIRIHREVMEWNDSVKSVTDLINRLS